MKKNQSDALGTEPIGKLLVQQAVPASIGILVMSLNVVVDTIFVGNWIGAIAIAAINVVLPISFFISAMGMAVGIGGASIISRALGALDKHKAKCTFGNQISLVMLVTAIMVFFGLTFADELIPVFGGKGDIFEPAKIYYKILLLGVPMLALSMVGTNVIRAEGKPTFAMIAMIIPSVTNLVLDYLFIFVFEWGMAGAAWATVASYALGLIYIMSFFFSGRSELKISFTHLKFKFPILKEISSLGFVTLARQAAVSITYLLMNNLLFAYGGETSVAAYGIIGRMLMFALFPVMGMTQGFLPIAGYNYGAHQYQRVRQSINRAITFAGLLALGIFLLIQFFAPQIVTVFTTEPEILVKTPDYMRWVFAATPIIAIQLIGSAYFQAIGKAVPALLLTLTRQGFFFIPLVLILPQFFGEIGIWVSFPMADVLSTIVTGYFLNREIRKNLYVLNVEATEPKL
ncbi:MAG TPA: MATE family efflux transporter [Flavobacteriaceae bacterium]|nr:MATE family efflux transporter [Flavobacteriaceae bacterium]